MPRGLSSEDAVAPRVLRVLLATRPPSERTPVALVLALSAHALLALGVALTGPLGGVRDASSETEGTDGESTVTLLVRRPPRAARASSAVRPAPRATRSTQPLAVPGAVIPARAAPLAAPPSPNGTSVVHASEPPPMVSRFLPRYLAPPSPALDPTPDVDRAAARIGRALSDVADSLVTTEVERRRLRDWRVGKGSPWGFTPDGRPRLGGLPVPKPLRAELATAPGARERARHEQANWSDSQRAAAAAEARHMVAARIRAVRERRARERADSAANRR